MDSDRELSVSVTEDGRGEGKKKKQSGGFTDVCAIALRQTARMMQMACEQQASSITLVTAPTRGPLWRQRQPRTPLCARGPRAVPSLWVEAR